MIYKIIDIQGIGPVYAEKLIAIGIETVDQLLEKGADPKGRQAIEEATGIDHGRVLTWVNHADLFRVKGIGPQFSELLEAAGVDTVKRSTSAAVPRSRRKSRSSSSSPRNSSRS